MIQTSEGPAYVGDFHVHTSLSDGQVEPLAIAESAQAKGFDFLGIADHDHCAELEIGLNEQLRRVGTNLLVLSAEEVSLVAGLGHGVIDDHIGHLLALGIRQEIHQAIGQTGKLSHLRRAEIICDQVHQQGGLAILAHPFWQPVTLNPDWSPSHFHCDLQVTFGLLESGRLDGLEIANHAVADSNQLTQLVVRLGRKIQPGLIETGGSDAHRYEQLGAVLNYVFAEELTESAILAALRANRNAVWYQDQFFGNETLVTAIRKALSANKV